MRVCVCVETGETVTSTYYSIFMYIVHIVCTLKQFFMHSGSNVISMLSNLGELGSFFDSFVQKNSNSNQRNHQLECTKKCFWTCEFSIRRKSISSAIRHTSTRDECSVKKDNFMCGTILHLPFQFLTKEIDFLVHKFYFTIRSNSAFVHI